MTPFKVRQSRSISSSPDFAKKSENHFPLMTNQSRSIVARARISLDARLIEIPLFVQPAAKNPGRTATRDKPKKKAKRRK
jgi:hypothetical protein